MIFLANTHALYTRCFIGLVASMFLFIFMLSMSTNFCLTRFKYQEKKMTILVDTVRENENSDVQREKNAHQKFTGDDFIEISKIQSSNNKRIVADSIRKNVRLKAQPNVKKLPAKKESTQLTYDRSIEREPLIPNSAVIAKGTTPTTTITATTTTTTTTLANTESSTNLFSRTKSTILSTITPPAPTSIQKTSVKLDLESLTKDQKISRLKKLLEPKEKKCTPVDNIIFLKTHKTGSSTLINIFQRYIIKHNKTIALPSNNNLLGWPNTFKEQFILNHSTNQKYNIICNHARFHKQNMLDVMTNNNTKIVTILRDPLSQFQSTVVYLHFDKIFNLSKAKNESILESFFKLDKRERLRRINLSGQRGKYLAINPNTYDMGYPTIHKKPKLQHILKNAESDFNLIMISNYMEESLILLKDSLCWDLKDIVYFSLNKRPSKYRQKLKNTEKARQDTLKWNDVDAALFEHFNTSLWNVIKSKGETFQQDLKHLKEANSLLADLCLQKKYSLDKSQPWFPILGHKLKSNLDFFPFKELCRDMIKSEIVFDNELKKMFLKNKKH